MTNPKDKRIREAMKHESKMLNFRNSHIYPMGFQSEEKKMGYVTIRVKRKINKKLAE